MRVVALPQMLSAMQSIVKHSRDLARASDVHQALTIFDQIICHQLRSPFRNPELMRHDMLYRMILSDDLPLA